MLGKLLFYKREQSKVIKWNLIFYLVTFVYSILLGVILVPMYLNYIPREVYGYWLATGNILMLLTLIDPGFSAVVQQKVSLNYGKNDLDIVGKYASVGLVFGCFFSFLMLIIGGVVYWNFMKIFPGVQIAELSEIQLAFGYTLLGSVLMLIYYIWGAIAIGLLSSKGIGIINTVGNFGSLFSIIYMLHAGYGVLALGIAALLRGGLFLFLSIGYVLIRFYEEKISFSCNKTLFKEFLTLMGFNFLGKIGVNLINQINSYVSTVCISPIAATTLKFTQTVPEFSKVLAVRVANASTPVIPNLHGANKTEELKHLIKNVLFVVAWILGLIVAGFTSLSGSFITLWVGADYYGGDYVNLLVMFVLILSVFSEVLSQVVFALGDIKRNSMLFFIQGLLYVPLAFWGAKNYGISGLLIASVISFLFTSAWYFPYSLCKLLDIKRKTILLFLRELFIIGFIVTVVINLHEYFIHFENNWMNIAISACMIGGGYLFSLFILSKGFRKFFFVRIYKRKLIIR